MTNKAIASLGAMRFRIQSPRISKVVLPTQFAKDLEMLKADGKPVNAKFTAAS